MAHLLGLQWLTTFLSLHTKFLPEPQDFLMEQGTNDFQKSTGKELRCSQASAISKLVLSELQVPVYENHRWVESQELVMPVDLYDLFAEHSTQAVIPSLALFVEDDKAKRDVVGRWRPCGSDDYARTFWQVTGII